MRSDAFKNKGYGTQAELLALDYAFNTMELSTVYADSLIGNTRSQHVLKKVGFQDTGRDANFIYYECKKADWKARKHANRRWVVPDSHIIAHLRFKRNKIFILLRSFCITVR